MTQEFQNNSATKTTAITKDTKQETTITPNFQRNAAWKELAAVVPATEAKYNNTTYDLSKPGLDGRNGLVAALFDRNKEITEALKGKLTTAQRISLESESTTNQEIAKTVEAYRLAQTPAQKAKILGEVRELLKTAEGFRNDYEKATPKQETSQSVEKKEPVKKEEVKPKPVDPIQSAKSELNLIDSSVGSDFNRFELEKQAGGLFGKLAKSQTGLGWKSLTTEGKTKQLLGNAIEDLKNQEKNIYKLRASEQSETNPEIKEKIRVKREAAELAYKEEVMKLSETYDKIKPALDNTDKGRRKSQLEEINKKDLAKYQREKE